MKRCTLPRIRPRLVRYARTRPAFKDRLPAKPAKSSSDDVTLEDAVDALGERKGTTRSRFATSNGRSKSTQVDSRLTQFQHKSPAQIERELKETFARDGVEYDPLFVQQMIRRSKQEENIINDTMKGGSALQKVTEEEVTSFIDWLIDDCITRLPDQGVGESEIERGVDEKMEKVMRVKNDDKSLIDAFSSVYELADELRPSGLSKLKEFLSVISKPDNGEIRKMVPIEKMVKLFEISGQLLDDKLRDECVYLSGNLIYSSTKARADPINEKLYIETLVNHGDFQRALDLYTSRKSKPDVIDQRFWLEVGIGIYLRMGSDEVEKAELLAREMKDKYGYIHPIVISTFIDRYLRLSRLDKATEWVQEMKEVMDSYGLVDHLEVPGPQLLDDPQQVYDYYNRIDPVSYDHVTDCVIDFLKYRQVPEAMEVIMTATRRDRQYLLYLVGYIAENVSYPGREYLLQVLKGSEDGNAEGPQFNPAISSFIQSELENFRPTKCSSIEEVIVLDECSFFLTKQLANPKVDSEMKLKISSLISSISIGAKLTSHECKDMMKIILRSNSRKGYTLASKVLSQMNRGLEKEHGEDGMLPPANAHIYLTLVQVFGRRPKPKTREIEELLETMKGLGIPTLTVLANQVVLAYRKGKQYSKALRFIDEYLREGEEEESFKPTSEFFQNVLVTYREGLMQDGGGEDGNYKFRLEKLRWLFKSILSSPGWKLDEGLCNEAVMTFMTYGDYASTICVLESYGMEMKKDIGNDLMVAIKLKLEAKLMKLNLEGEEIDQYRRECGILSVRKDLKPDRVNNWRDAAEVIIRYMEATGYGLGGKSSDEVKQRSKDEFEGELIELERMYGLPEVGLGEIS
ncbi:DEKNAAC105445 [Brettanomyces naardenensis]|uniref:DEKNAAC105445 n=1 Tax=Brettanomyces naardenensis TaxID=13370 RepID=A0A448YTD8_BRENA|nr:DEKNAAC105445 [Brettanomyces naardenensis]